MLYGKAYLEKVTFTQRAQQLSRPPAPIPGAPASAKARKQPAAVAFTIADLSIAPILKTTRNASE